MTTRFFFAAGPGNIIEAHKDWTCGHQHPGQMSVTFSSEFEGFCRDIGVTALMVSSASPAARLQDQEFTLEHRPKRQANGLRYHLEEIRYGIGLLRSAYKFGATHAFIQSGSTYYFMMSVFVMLGIKVVPIMHNTLWPAGYPRTSKLKLVIRWLDGLFFRYGASAILAVSPECSRQVRALTKGRHAPIEQFTIQFVEENFRPTPPLPLSDHLVMTFSGRVTEDKGALDLIQIASELLPKTKLAIHVCGDGPSLPRLADLVKQHHLDQVIHLHGWTEPHKLRQIISASHFSIVPTRSEFNEGMAMTVIEPVLLGRPVITNPVVPALEVLRDACIEAEADNPQSYAREIVKVVSAPDRYKDLCENCLKLREQFFDRSKSFHAALLRLSGR